MHRPPAGRACFAAVLLSAGMMSSGCSAQDAPASSPPADRPGLAHGITAGALPPPFSTRSVSAAASFVERPAGALPAAPPGWTVSILASGLDQPRSLRIAPDGALYLAETGGGRILRFSGKEIEDTRQHRPAAVTEGLDSPFGMAFWPPGPNPSFLYVAETERVLRFPLQGAMPPRPETVLSGLPGGGHTTRDLLPAPDGRSLLISIGSGSNIYQPPRKTPEALAAWDAAHGTGSAWGEEENRAQVLSFAPEGGELHAYAAGLRNCVSMALEPASRLPWCVVNERDGLGDDLPPDYAAAVRQGDFYGWPWFYTGAHADPRLRWQRPDLASRVRVPDLLIQAHSAPLGIAFGTDAAFIALHGSWNRSQPTGYKVIRAALKNGAPADGRYQDFLTGFLTADGAWGRPVGIAVTARGTVLVSDDAGGIVWRVQPPAKPGP